jgi:hypothetical protein
MAVQHGIGRSAGTSKSKLGVFEIGKGGVRVATLILPQTTFKLGDMIQGIEQLRGGDDSSGGRSLLTWNPYPTLATLPPAEVSETQEFRKLKWWML